jgi:AraC family transcriptional regulator
MINRYKENIEEVVQYVEHKIRTDWRTMASGEDFSEATKIEKLTGIALMGRRNLQLYFKAYMHEGIQSYISRRRLEYAQLLMKQSDIQLCEVADRLGFANQQALSNMMKERYDASPTDKREELIGMMERRIQGMKVDEPHRKSLTAFPLLYLSYTGNYSDYASDVFEEVSWNRLQEYAELKGWADAEPQYWGIAFDDTDITDADQCRFYAAVSINPKLNYRTKANDEMKVMTLPGGNYLVFTYRGEYTGLDAFYDAVIRCLPRPLGNGPILERYLNSPADVAEEELITEVWIPIN